MKIPVVRGVIDRRILVNYHIDAEVLANVLPEPFRPKLVKGMAIGGICLIRLKRLRPRFLPFPWGMSSENAAHRFAVEWDEDGRTVEGVYIPRRDTNSRWNTLVGGRLFPGLHHHATFTVKEDEQNWSVELTSDDQATRLKVVGEVTTRLPTKSVFSSLQEASTFFEEGSLGYSTTLQEGRYDGLELRCQNWSVQPLAVKEVESSYFEQTSRFPEGSIGFDCALLMQDIQHEWHSQKALCCPVPA